MSIVHQFKRIAALNCEATAIAVCVEDSWIEITYEELEREACQLATALQQLGVKRGDAVILPPVRSSELPVRILAILWVGAHYVFIDPKYPLDRQQLILQETAARFGFGQQVFPHLALQWLDGLCDESSVNVTSAAIDCPVLGDAEDKAYVMFTSGSTGQPKGVMVPHRAIQRLVVDTDYIAFSQQQTYLLHSNLSFDASTFELWGALLNGGRCVFFPEHNVITASSLQQIIQDRRVNTLWLTSSLFNAIIDDSAIALSGIKQLLIGGEALSAQHVVKAYQQLNDITIFNGYGPTENTTFTTVYAIPRSLTAGVSSVPIGKSINGTECDVYSESLMPVTAGETGELICFGQGLALGYLNKDELTKEKFVAVTRSSGDKQLGYRTGDRVRLQISGDYEYLGRIDKQVKIDGYRIELAEIELQLQKLDTVQQARVVIKQGTLGQKRMVAYIIESQPRDIDYREALKNTLPAYMLPHIVIRCKEYPINQNGKLDEARLPNPFSPVATEEEQGRQLSVSQCWFEILQRRVDHHVNFLDAGGTSLEAVKLAQLLSDQYQIALPDTFVFQYSTIRSQQRYFSVTGESGSVVTDSVASSQQNLSGTKPEFAVIGMSCRLPGATNVQEYWHNLLAKEESITFFNNEELIAEGLGDDISLPGYVPAKGVIDNVEQFDAGFFDIPPLEADVMDPQQRIMLQLAWHALEDSGYPPSANGLSAGVFAGANWPRYYQQNILNNDDINKRIGNFNASLANEADFLSTRISYKLNLHGPSVNVYTACSTGLVAIAQACTAIANGQCDMALAGGASVSTPLKSGYRHQEGGMLSADGHCRTFDAQASGTTFNDGAGFVVIKRLDLAERDGDNIYAVVKGYDVNNDGSTKASYTAPSIDGQIAVYKGAIQSSGIPPEKVGFIETHGTATPLGDPIEVSALKQVYSIGDEDGQSTPCFLGSVKSNIGHTIHAAGVASFIKAVLSVKEGQIPATLHYKNPNPKLNLESTRFFVNAETQEWESNGPRVAAVSSLGVGGTNAHIILQQYKATDINRYSDIEEKTGKEYSAQKYPFIFSAKSDGSLKALMADYIKLFSSIEDVTELADFSHTMVATRPSFDKRYGVIASSVKHLVDQLLQFEMTKENHCEIGVHATTGFLFTGQGAQRKGMGFELYETDAEYCEIWDRGCAQLQKEYAYDLNAIVFGEKDRTDSELDIQQTAIAQPALFLLEYAAAVGLMRRGCQPDFLIGHSIGEYAAAVIAGVMTFSDALAIVARRGHLMQRQKPGVMLAVRASYEDVETLLPPGVDVAAKNAPELNVLSGNASAIEKAKQVFEKKGIAFSELKTSHAFHSRMMEPMLEEFKAYLYGFELSAPKIPIVSTATGSILSSEEACSAEYWASQIRRPVLYSEALSFAVDEFGGDGSVMLEIGPAANLTGLLAMHQFDANTVGMFALPSQGDKAESACDVLDQLTMTLWQKGASIDWQAWFAVSGDKSIYRRKSLPLYPFDTKRHWVDKPSSASGGTHSEQLDSNVLASLTQMMNALGAVAPAACGAEINQDIEMTNADKTQAVMSKLKLVFEDITGFDLDDVEPDAHFSQAGLDSLLLTQVSIALQQQFGGDITFRNLMEDYTSFAELTDYYIDTIPVESDSALPAEPSVSLAADQMQASMAALPAVQINSGNGGVAELIAAQLQLMQLQLQALGGGLSTTAPVLGASSAIAEPTAPSTAETTSSSDAGEAKRSRHAPGAKVTREAVGVELSQAQQEWINAVMLAYQQKFAGSKAYAQEHRQHLADPRTVSGFSPEWKETVFQLVTKASKGSRLWDIDGNELIDITNGFGPIFFGHSPDFVSEAVKNQIDLGIETGPQSPLAGEVAQLFCKITGNERCTFANSGSEAIVGALRLARTVTGRQKVVMFTGAYHGIVDEVITRPGKGGQALPSAPGIPRESLANMIVLPWGEDASVEKIRELGGELAAVLVEAVQSRNPGFNDADYIHKLRDVTQETGSALILDEVVTGFRVAPGGIQERFEVEADLAVYGKVVGGGYPIGIIGGKAKFMDALDGGYWQFGDDSIPEVGVTFFAGTFVRHPLCLAATKAVLDRLQQLGHTLYDEMECKTSTLVADANAFIDEMNCEVKINSFSSFFYLSIPESSHWGHLFYTLMQTEGIFVQQYRPCFLTTEHSPQDIDKVLTAFKQSLAQMIEKGLIEGDMLAAKKYIGENKKIPEGARLGKNKKGEPAYFIEDPENKGQYIEVGKP